MHLLLVLLIISFFVPESIALQVGQVKLTFTLIFSIFLFPMLLGAGRLRWIWTDFLVVALLACYLVSMAMSTTLGRTIEAMGRTTLIIVVPYLAGRYIMQDLCRMAKLLGLLALMLGITAAFSLLESLARFNIHSVLWDVPYSPHHEKRLGLTRAHGWTSHAIMFGLVNASFLAVILVAAKEKIGVFGRWQWLKFLAIGMGCFLSLSTGAWGPAAIAIMLVAWDYYSPMPHKNRWPITFAVLIIGYFLLEFASGRPLLRIMMMELHLTSADAWYYRWRLYERVFEVMPGHWWLGHGLDTPEAFVGFQRSIDNNFLVVLLKHGMIGLILWIAVPVGAILYAGKVVWVGKPTRLVRISRALCFSLIGIVLTQLSVALFSTPGSFYWLIIGLIVGATMMCRHEKILRARAGRERRRRQSFPRVRSSGVMRNDVARPSNDIHTDAAN